MTLNMRKFLTLGFLKSVSAVLSLTAAAYGQDVSQIEKYCYPQITESAAASFASLEQAGVVYAKSDISVKRGGETSEIRLQVWPRQKVVLLNSKLNGPKQFESVVLYHGKGCFVDRSDLPGFGSGSLSRLRGVELSYPNELAYLACAAILSPMYLVDPRLQIDKKHNAIDRFLIDDKAERFMAFLADQSAASRETFDFSGIKMTLTKTGFLVDEIDVESQDVKMSVKNRFVYSPDDEDYREFVQSDYYFMPDFGDMKSFGFKFADKSGKVRIDFNENWSRFLYGAAKISALVSGNVVAVDGKEIDTGGIERLNALLGGAVDRVMVEFEGGKRFVFRKFPFETYESIEILSKQLKNDIFWDAVN